MAEIIEIITDILKSHSSNSEMTTDQLIQEIQKVYTSLQELEAISPIASSTSPATEASRQSSWDIDLKI